LCAETSVSDAALPALTLRLLRVLHMPAPVVLQEVLEKSQIPRDLVRPGGFDVRSDVLDFLFQPRFRHFAAITEIETDRPVQGPSPPVAAGADFFANRKLSLARHGR
jgi:hypothetical protein